MRAIIITLGIAAISVWSAGASLAGDFIYGCMGRAACGKVCKLVCETSALTAVGYGCECKEICIPGPSRRGSKHCDMTCCPDNEIEGRAPKIEFCWYDWFACGCAKPRSIRVLTKYQAEKEICSYHWEVVDGCNCSCQGHCRCVYKPAPENADVGEVIELNQDEQLELATWLAAEPEVASVDASPAADDAARQRSWQRMAEFWGVTDNPK
jgi:hypothetical protein